MADDQFAGTPYAGLDRSIGSGDGIRLLDVQSQLMRATLYLGVEHVQLVRDEHLRATLVQFRGVKRGNRFWFSVPVTDAEIDGVGGFPTYSVAAIARDRIQKESS